MHRSYGAFLIILYGLQSVNRTNSIYKELDYSIICYLAPVIRYLCAKQPYSTLLT